MWTRRVRPGRDDRLERNGLRAFVVEELLDRPGDLTLGAADERLFDEPLEHAVGDLAGPLDGGELVRVLDRTESLHETPPRHGLDRAATERFVAGVRDEVGLESDRPRQPVGKVGD